MQSVSSVVPCNNPYCWNDVGAPLNIAWWPWIVDAGWVFVDPDLRPRTPLDPFYAAIEWASDVPDGHVFAGSKPAMFAPPGHMTPSQHDSS